MGLFILFKHPRWKEDIGFVSYVAPPIDGDQAEMEEWLERLSFIEDDLHTLLRMPHNKFWCQVFDVCPAIYLLRI